MLLACANFVIPQTIRIVHAFLSVILAWDHQSLQSSLLKLFDNS